MKIAAFIFLYLLIVFILLRFLFILKLIKKQDQEILKLNLRIQEKDDFIVELIKKYGNPKEGKAFLNKLKTKLNQDK